MSKFTHIAKFYSIPCYFNEQTMDVKGTNFFYDKLIDIRIFIEDIFPSEDGYKIEVVKPI
ncbi:hypothetical protein DBR40_05260 [Pedobacter sp. KBW01]|uniref:hypothetical protein n=1 Tax=Pedobacter sp. KBW01 TaxID=2153364 RepID=UPI000F596264|nr:hypothetical protein [Pedobacter sp. KBW01]RQO79129.1 hypothetical protein DBR40_05260 [Pedobacter sp. KBW01]